MAFRGGVDVQSAYSGRPEIFYGSDALVGAIDLESLRAIQPF